MSQDVPEIPLSLFNTILREISMLGIRDMREDLGAPDSLDVLLSVCGKLVAVDLPRSGSSSEAEVIQCLSEVGCCDLERWNKAHSSTVQTSPKIKINFAHLPGPWTTTDENRSNFIETDSGPCIASQLSSNILGSHPDHVKSSFGSTAT